MSVYLLNDYGPNDPGSNREKGGATPHKLWVPLKPYSVETGSFTSRLHGLLPPCSLHTLVGRLRHRENIIIIIIIIIITQQNR